MTEKTEKPSVQIKTGLEKLLKESGELNRFALHFQFDFNSLYKIAKSQIKQPGVDYGSDILDALSKWRSNNADVTK